MQIAYLLNSQFDIKVTEISYEKETPKMIVGVKKIRDVVGRAYYVSSKIDKASVIANIGEALAAAESVLIKSIDRDTKALEQVRNAK